MKHRIIFAAFAVAVAAALLSSCAKDNTIIPDDPFANGPKDEYQAFDVDLAFAAPQGMAETTVFFFDEEGVQVNAQTVLVPSSANDVVNTTFVSESRPVYIYTPGLQNAGENGYLSIPEGSIETKAGGKTPVLLVIR